MSMDPEDLAGAMKAIARIAHSLADAVERQSAIHVECLRLVAQFAEAGREASAIVTPKQREILTELAHKHGAAVQAAGTTIKCAKLQMQEWVV
jgi:DNA-binding response OmpR family regulator